MSNHIHQTRIRRSAALVMASALVATMAGCAPAEETPDGPVTINVTAASNPWVSAIKPHLAEFEAESGIKVVLSEFGNDQLSEQNQVKLNAQSSDIDVLLMRPAQELKLFADNGWLLELETLAKGDTAYQLSDFQASTLESVSTADGKLYGIPLMTERHIMYYNSELLEKAGVAVPTTMAELEAAAAAINDPAAGVFGVALRGALNASVTSFASFLYSFGGDWQNADGTSGVGAPEAIAAYEYYGNLVSKYGPPGATSMGWTEASAIFAQGKAGFYIDADSQAFVFDDPNTSIVQDVVGYAPFPAGPAGAKPYNVTPWALGINSYSKKQDAAWKFIQWSTSVDMFKTAMVDQKSPSPRDSSWSDSTATAGFPESLINIVSLYSEIGVGYDRPRNIQVGMARDIVGGPVVAAIEGRNVAEAAAEANTKYNEFLKTDK